MIRLYEEIVGRGGVSPTHFFYEMTFHEAAAFMRGRDRQEQEEWNRARRIMWASLLPHSKGRISPEDIIKFSWEDEKAIDEVPDVREIERIRDIAKNLKI